MKYFLLLLLTGAAVKCDDNYFVVEAPEDYAEDHERPFNVYWNVPTMQCMSKKIPFNNLYEKYGIHQNKDDSFRGDVVAILYDPGLFPALLKNKTSGTLHFRNGGVPQEGDLELHLKTFKSHLNKNIPDPDFNGVGIIDFEWWRPIFRQNMGNLVITKNISIEIQKNLHWEPDQDLHKETRLRFEKAARTFMKTTLAVAKQMRPNALWGYYGFPYCFNMANKNMKETCADKIPEENDRTRWLWSESTALYPSVYSSKDLTSSELASLIRGRIKEAQRVKKKSTAVLPYFWFRYREGGFLTEEDLNIALETFYKSHASGFIIWGSSEDVNTVAKCKELRHYVENTLGPAISEFTKAKTKTRGEILQTKKKAPQHKVTEITNHTYHDDLELYWKPPENCIQDINKYVEEELQRKGYSFNDITEVMTNVNYSIHIKIPFHSLENLISTEQGQSGINQNEIKISQSVNEDCRQENSVTELLKDIQSTPNFQSKETSPITRKMIILKKLLQIQELTKEILALEAAETIDLKDVTHEYLKADFSTLQHGVKKDDIELTSKPRAKPVVLNDTLSAVENNHTDKLDIQASVLPRENVSNEIMPNGTESEFKTSTKNYQPKLLVNQSANTENSTVKSTDSYENSNETSSGDNSIVKLLENSEETTKPPILHITQIVVYKDIIREDTITEVPSLRDSVKEENLELKPLPAESLDLNNTLSITESSTIETIYTLPTTSVSDEIMPNGTRPTEDLVPKLSQNQISSTVSMYSHENSDKTSDAVNLITNLTHNHRATTKSQILETIPLRNDTQKELSFDFVAIQNDTKKEDIDFELKPLPKENSQLNDTLHYTIETSTSEFQDAETLLKKAVSDKINIFKTSTDDLVPEVLENQTSSTESIDSYKNSDNALNAEQIDPKSEENRQVTTETSISEATTTIGIQDIFENNVNVDVTTLQYDLKEENIKQVLETETMEAMQLNDTLYYTIETSTTEFKEAEKLPKEAVSDEINIFKTSTDDLVPEVLENQTSSKESIDSYKNSDKALSGEQIDPKSEENRQLTAETSISEATPTIGIQDIFENKVNVNATTLQYDLKKENIKQVLETETIEAMQLNDTLYYNIETPATETQDKLTLKFSTENVRKDIIMNDSKSTLKTSAGNLIANILKNQTSSAESTQNSKHLHKIASGKNNGLNLLLESNQKRLEVNSTEISTEMPGQETPHLLDNQQMNIEITTLATQKIIDFKDAKQEPVNIDVAREQNDVETKDTEFELPTTESLHDILKKEEKEVSFPTVSSQLDDPLFRTETSSTIPQDLESENDVFETTTFETITNDKSNSVELLEHQQAELNIENHNFTEPTKISNISVPIDGTYKSDYINTIENNNKNISVSNDFFTNGTIIEFIESTETMNTASAVNLTKTEGSTNLESDKDIVNMMEERSSTEASTADR